MASFDNEHFLLILCLLYHKQNKHNVKHKKYALFMLFASIIYNERWNTLGAPSSIHTTLRFAFFPPTLWIQIFANFHSLTPIVSLFLLKSIISCHTVTVVHVYLTSMQFKHSRSAIFILCVYILKETNRILYFNRTRTQHFIIYKFMRWCYLNAVVIATHST